MIDLRKTKELDLSKAKCLKENIAYQFKDEIAGKDLIAKFIGYYDDSNDDYLLGEFKKIFLLSGEPEIATIYFLASAKIGEVTKNCYVMDFIHGKTIGQILRENKNLRFDFIIDIIKQLASGLEKSHNYEISHGDLHEENILINDLGFVKIIDFAFWGGKIDFQKNVDYDIECFSKIVAGLVDKCYEYERVRVNIVRKLCSSIKSFKGLRKNINLIEEVIFDYNLLDANGKAIISAIINVIPFEISLSTVLQEEDIEIPFNPQFDQTDEEKKFMDAENSPKGVRIKFSDQRMERISDHINRVFHVKLHQLKQAALINWNVWVTNSGKKFLGPYKYNYAISITPKILRWKRLDEIVPFLGKSGKMDLTELLVSDIKNEIDIVNTQDLG